MKWNSIRAKVLGLMVLCLAVGVGGIVVLMR
jgi:hypothetical protein